MRAHLRIMALEATLRGTLRPLAPLAMASLLVACPNDTITGPIAGLPFATASPSCGPTDGAAVEITLAASDNPASTPRVQVALYESLSNLTGRWTLVTDVGMAQHVSSSGTRESARSGIVVIDKVDAMNTVTGTVQLSFPEAGIIRGRFRANWVPRMILCG